MKRRGLLISLLIVGAILLLIFVHNPNSCLNNRYEFSIEWDGPTVFVSTYNNTDKLSSFEVTELSSSANNVQITNCHVYVVRNFSTGSSRSDQLDYQLWRYDPLGNTEIVIKFHKLLPKANTQYSVTTAISIDGKFIALKEYAVEYRTSDPNDALVIKKLNDLDKDYLKIPLSEIYRTSNIMGSPTLLRWSKDSKNLWFELSEAAIVNGFGKINVVTKTFEIYKAPDGTMGGDAFNLESSWITYDPKSFWCGEITCTNDERQDRIRRGMSSELYVYNLITKESILVESYKPDPLWYYKPRWISDSVLSYVLPDGTTKRYNVTKKQHVLE